MFYFALKVLYMFSEAYPVLKLSVSLSSLAVMKMISDELSYSQKQRRKYLKTDAQNSNFHFRKLLNDYSKNSETITETMKLSANQDQVPVGTDVEETAEVLVDSHLPSVPEPQT